LAKHGKNGVNFEKYWKAIHTVCTSIVITDSPILKAKINTPSLKPRIV